MDYFGADFEVGAWQLFEIALVGGVAMLIISWLILTRFRRQGLMSWSVVIFLCFGMSTVCVQSRLNAMQLDSLLSNGQNIEIIDGAFHYGEYHFSNEAKHGIDYREISLDGRSIKLYHSGYLPSSKCYRALYSQSQFSENVNLRLYIHWYESEYLFKQQTYSLKAPCIIKIEQLNTADQLIAVKRI